MYEIVTAEEKGIVVRNEERDTRFLEKKEANQLFLTFFGDQIINVLQAYFDDDFQYRASELQENVKNLRRFHRKEWLHLIELASSNIPDSVLQETYGATEIRHIASNIKPNKIKECIICGKVFYDAMPGGKKTYCSRMSIVKKGRVTSCEREVNNRRARACYNRERFGVSTHDYHKIISIYKHEKLFEPTLESLETLIHNKSEISNDPQDIVCGTRKTHVIYRKRSKGNCPLQYMNGEEGKYKRRPLSEVAREIRNEEMVDSGGDSVFTVNIIEGQRKDNSGFTFEGQILPIKAEKDLPPKRNL
ncbi:hypothetical protein [Bacillus sp. XF8]|uniref:hypothetical protein n=1 Tax=Bacillus sp. XF8 TaxID=2819289 RepID=UPI001AA05376|nr:hypothetical protein [Bacillus sp. XF8]MBO1579980.1 hypothetical protein [Bacillus sp. XF8]